MKQPVEVVILGHRLTVTSDDGADHVREVVAYVDEQMRILAAGRAPATIVQLALLTALNMASELRKVSQEREELQRLIDRLSDRVAHLVPPSENAVGKEKATPAEVSSALEESTPTE